METPQQHDTLLITGSNGLIGYAVADRLAGNYPVVGFMHHTKPAPPPTVDRVTADMTLDESVRQALEEPRERHGSHIASAIHLATYYDFSGEHSHLYEDLTIRGTQRLLRGLQSFQVEQFIFSSTMLVYAPSTPGHPINEDSPVEPKWDYPKSKVHTEETIRAERGNIPAVILRIAGVYDDLCHSIPLAHQIQRIYERQLVGHLYPGDVTHGQAYVHLDDLVDLYARLVRRRKELPDDTLLLVGEPETLSYDELQRAFGQLIHGENWDTRVIPKEVAKAGAWLEDESRAAFFSGRSCSVRWVEHAKVGTDPVVTAKQPAWAILLGLDPRDFHAMQARYFSRKASGARRATPSMITCVITSAISSDDIVASSWLHWIAVPKIAQLTTRAIVSSDSCFCFSPPRASVSHIKSSFVNSSWAARSTSGASTSDGCCWW